MSFTRAARHADLDALTAFDEWNRATHAAIDAGTCFVAGHDDDVLAYGIFHRAFFGRPFVDTVFVHPDHRRTGLGTSLVRHFESIADHRQLWISTNIKNLGMQRTLQNCGFRLSGVVNDLGKLPELFYHKALDA